MLSILRVIYHFRIVSRAINSITREGERVLTECQHPERNTTDL